MHLQAACTAAHCCGLAIRALVGAPAPHDFDDAAPRRVLAARRYYNQSRFGRRDPATQTLRSWDSMVEVAVLVAPQLAPTHGLHRLHLKAWGCPPHSGGEAQQVKPHREAVWPCRGRPPKLTISLRLTIQVGERRVGAHAEHGRRAVRDARRAGGRRGAGRPRRVAPRYAEIVPSGLNIWPGRPCSQLSPDRLAARMAEACMGLPWACS